ncbi:MAG: ParB N-terminal domain-containing protein [Candidatus Pacebacteria bacterium]|jgi:DNA modification methylase|nr:ParB N-terminal domain-containing protein [Candidatus Paceibacterota bacterium]
MAKDKITWSPATRRLVDLTKNGYNPRKLSENERRDLEKSVQEFGTVVPIILNIGTRANTIIGGEQRVKVYANLGIDEVECMVPSRELTLDEERELNLRLNKNTGSWDEELLKDFDMSVLLGVGFGDDELQNLFDDVDVVDDDYNLEKALKETITPKVKSGEIWELGKHRLLVGDSTDGESVQKLMAGDLADVVYCDSPYNIGLDYSKGVSNKEKYQGSYSSKDDSKKDSDFMTFLDKSMDVAKSVSKKDAHFFYWCDSSYVGMVQSLYGKHKIDAKRVCLWIKNNQNPTHKIAFNKVYEPCVYGTIGKPYLNTGMHNANEILNQEVTTGNQVHDEILDMIDIWIEKRDSAQSYQHPTQKPVTLNEKPLKRCSAPLHIVFSGFAGSGSDLIACEELGRAWRGVEKDLIFATIVIDRWEKFTNQKAVKIHEGN